jgi:hypothetical protein
METLENDNCRLKIRQAKNTTDIILEKKRVDDKIVKITNGKR